MNDKLAKDSKFQLLRDLCLPEDDYVIFGSAPLYAHGLRQEVADLDIVARGRAWQIVASLGKSKTAPSGNGRMVELYGGKLQFFDRWVTPDWDTDRLIDEAENIDGLPFVQLKNVLRSKSQTNRPKDQKDLHVLHVYYDSH